MQWFTKNPCGILNGERVEIHGKDKYPKCNFEKWLLKKYV